MADELESVSPRWAASSSSNKDWNILWAGICRDEIILAEHFSQDDSKIRKASRRVLSKPAKAGWDFHAYGTQSQSRLVHAVKFHLWERPPIKIGDRAKLRGLENQKFLNGATVRILDYYADTDKYLIRPTIPLVEAEKLSTTGNLVVKSEFLMTGETQLRVWNFVCIYDAKKINQLAACQFLEKIVVIAETFRSTDPWTKGKEYACMEQFAPILEAQMEQFQNLDLAATDDSLDYCKKIIVRNTELMSEGSC